MSTLARKALFGGVVAAAAGVPYGLHQISNSEAQPAQSARSDLGAIPLASEDVEPWSPTNPASASTSQPLAGNLSQQVAELFSFDHSTSWVMSRWPRVLTIHAGGGLVGYRVPLVTGTSPEDLTGALTYYFNTEHRLARITFEGRSGEFQMLAEHLVEHYQFRPIQSPNPRVQLYQMHYDGQVRSQLAIETAAILHSDAAHRRYQISLHLERPPQRRILTESKQVPDIRWP